MGPTQKFSSKHIWTLTALIPACVISWAAMALKEPRLVLWPVTWTEVFLGNKREWRRNLTASVGDSYQCIHGCSVQSSAARTGLLPLLLGLGQRGCWHKHRSLLSFFKFIYLSFFSWLAGGSFLSPCDNALQKNAISAHGSPLPRHQAAPQICSAGWECIRACRHPGAMQTSAGCVTHHK